MYISSRVVHKSSNNTHIKFGTRNFCLFLFEPIEILVTEIRPTSRLSSSSSSAVSAAAFWAVVVAAAAAAAAAVAVDASLVTALAAALTLTVSTPTTSALSFLWRFVPELLPPLTINLLIH